MKYVLIISSLTLLAWAFTVTTVYMQAIDRIIQKLVDNLELKDYVTLSENVEVYNRHTTDLLKKFKIKDPTFRRIAIEHCRSGKPEFPDTVNIHAFQLNLGWNDTQAAHMFNLINTTRHLWMAFDDICHDESYVRYLDKYCPDF